MDSEKIFRRYIWQTVLGTWTCLANMEVVNHEFTALAFSPLLAPGILCPSHSCESCPLLPAACASMDVVVVDVLVVFTVFFLSGGVFPSQGVLHTHRHRHRHRHYLWSL